MNGQRALWCSMMSNERYFIVISSSTVLLKWFNGILDERMKRLKMHSCLSIRIAYWIPIYIQAFDSVYWTLFQWHGMAFESPIIIDLCTFFFFYRNNIIIYTAITYRTQSSSVSNENRWWLMIQCIHINLQHIKRPHQQIFLSVFLFGELVESAVIMIHSNGPTKLFILKF